MNMHYVPPAKPTGYPIVKCATVADVTLDQKDRWDKADAETAWNDATEYWKGNETVWTKAGIGFSQVFSKFFSGIDMQCDKLVDNDGCTQQQQCSDESRLNPAGTFILNSMAAIGTVKLLISAFW